jgi:hypothetical protein
MGEIICEFSLQRSLQLLLSMISLSPPPTTQIMANNAHPHQQIFKALILPMAN